jgi:hypothetical protein
MNRDVHEYFQTYDQCQRIGNLLTQDLTKLVNYYFIIKTISKMGI